MLVRDISFAAIDFESAGIRRGDTDVPIQIGIATMLDGRLDAATFFSSHLAADRPVTWVARKVHGISDADLTNAPTFHSLWPQLKISLSDRWIVSHGAGTEKRFLRAFPMHGFAPWVDTLVLARAVWPDAPSHGLGDLARLLDLEAACQAALVGFRWHDALSDAIASLLLLRRLIDLTGIADQPAEILLRADLSGYQALRRSASPRG
jgi:DNA polymerase-3 subunit epsilon